MSCELCKLKIKTTIYYEDVDMIVLDCRDCGVPMVVLKNHTMNLDRYTASHMMLVLTQAGKEAFGSYDFRIDTKQTKVLNHLHWHARIE